MTNTGTTKTNHYYKAWVALAMLATMVSLLLASTAKPSYATGATFTVTSILDDSDKNPGDRICDAGLSREASCTLRAAIQEANAAQGADTIDFNVIPALRDPDTGLATINPATPLPEITEQVTINGYTQPGASRNTLSTGTDAKLKIKLDGAAVTESNGVGLGIAAPDTVVEGLVIDHFTGLAGIEILGAADSVVVRQNFIGTDPAGAHARGNLIGILDRGGNHSVIGGDTPQDANLISGNQAEGIAIEVPASHALVSHNLIGTDRSGTAALGNLQEGVELNDSSANSVRNNTIAFNGSDGVGVVDIDGRFEATPGANRVLSNSIFSNDGIGINLSNGGLVEIGGGATANDAGDGDTGPNGFQNKPVISSAKTVSGLTTIKGNVNSHPNETYQVQFFSNPSGNEGKVFIGQRSVTTDKFGNVSFAFKPQSKVAVGRTITATATRNSSLDTSEFSAARTVASS